MKFRTLFLLIVLIAISLFAALNWSVFNTPATLSLGFGAVQAPPGLIMLGVVALLTVQFLLFSAFIRTSALLESRSVRRELDAMRDLAENAETSRFTRLQEFLQGELQKLADTDKESGTELLARLDRLEATLSSAVEQSGNSLAAYIGEIEDKLEKATPR